MSDWDDKTVMRIIREGHAKQARLTDANHDAVLRLSGDLHWSYEETLNYVVGCGMALARKHGRPEEAE
jgi:hypothetical protein